MGTTALNPQTAKIAGAAPHQIAAVQLISSKKNLRATLAVFLGFLFSACWFKTHQKSGISNSANQQISKSVCHRNGQAFRASWCR
jgi:hypothetical protein